MRKRKKDLKKEMEAASKDPLFLEDVKESMDSFKTSDIETARLIDVEIKDTKRKNSIEELKRLKSKISFDEESIKSLRYIHKP